MQTNTSVSTDTSPYWSRNSDDLLRELNANRTGLSSDEARERLKTFGPSTIETHAEVSVVGMFLNQFKSSIILILLFATIVSAFLREWTDAIIILIIVLASAVLSFVQEYNANNAAKKLEKRISVMVNVLRDGHEKSVRASQVVPGDVVALSAGNLIPADGVLLEGKDFFVNQAVLTGETFPVMKEPGPVEAGAGLTERSNCVFLGTHVRSGSGRALIVRTGKHTAFGEIAGRLALRPPETEFERGVRQLGSLLTEVMLVLVVAIFAVNVFFQKPILDSLLFSIALAVGLTPQLLPAIIDINLSKGSQNMAKRGIIVRRLASIENFGSMDILCTDKTGTLTLGVVHLDQAVDPSGQASDEARRLAWLNSHFQTGMKNPLDDAIMAGIKDKPGQAVKVDEIPYDFERKRMSIVVKEDGRFTLVSKGAFENVLSACSSIRMDGKDADLTQTHQEELHSRFSDWSEQGFRVLGLACADVKEKASYEPADETGLTFCGFLLFMDPPKKQVKATLERLRKLGVHLKIITGDNRLVARHIAEAIGMKDPVIMTGAEVERHHNETLWSAAERADIFAEVDPNEKERIILALKKRGHVVGYMGDGINDAPPLHSADVSISVENAVDVAKEVADFVLMRQDLDVLEQGIMEGRKTFANTLKYIFMATSANFGNMFSMAGASLLLPFLPMLPKQILLINFLNDLPEMTIANDNVDDEYVARPHRWEMKTIRRFMIVFGLLSSIFDFATFGVLYWLLGAGEQVFHTGWLIESVLSAGLVVFAVRSRVAIQHSRPSRLMMLVTAGVAVFVLALPYTPLAGPLSLTPLPGYILLILSGIVLVYFASAELIKRWFYRSI